MRAAPSQVTSIAKAYTRQGDVPFGIRLPDRLLHLYVIGQTGTGKSTLLGRLAAQDARRGHGFCLIDPHGDLARQLSAIFSERHRCWDAADPASPYGYNLLTHVSAAHRPLVASGLLETLKRQWHEAWGVRMEHLLRYAILALLEQPQADLRDVIRLFIEKDFRRQVVARVTDAQVRAFWTREYPAMNYQTAVDGVAAIANKLGAFLAHPVVRAAVTAPAEPLRFRRLMDEGEILIVNLAKGRLGNDIANVLGGLIVTSVMNAALSRHDLPESARRPFFLHVDEFHNFTTSAFAGMLSETRKYGLGLTLAHQHIVQTERSVFEAVLGNIGSLIVFRVGVLDAPVLCRQLDTVEERDLVKLPNHRAFVQLMVDGQKSKAFTATTWAPGR